jgi:type IV secretory pathway TraG/TraD family ATPase VirD4
MKTIIDALLELVTMLFESIESLFEKDHSYNGSLGDADKVLKRKHSKGNGLKIGNRFVSLGQIMNGGMLLLGKTGSGKSTKIYFQNLLSISELAPMSIVCLDLAEELRDTAGGYIEQVMDEQAIINFSNAKKSTITWNPLEDLKTEDVHRFSVDLVASNTSDSGSKDPIWDNLSASVISYCILLLKRIECITGLRGYLNIYNVRYLIVILQGEPTKINALISIFADDLLYSNFKAFLANDDKFLNSVLSNVLSVLVLWQDENVIRTTSSTSLVMESFRYERKILWIQSSITAQKRLKGLNSLFLKSWFDFIMASGVPSKEEHTIAFFADEISAVSTTDKGFIPFISSQIRKFKSFGIFGYQSYSQCINLYGKEGATTLRTNTGTVLYLGKQDLDTATHISKSLGRYSYKKDGKTLTREVMTPEEVMYQHTQEGGFLITSEERPICLKRIKAFYQDRAMRKRADIPTPGITANNPMPELLPIDDLIRDIKGL